MSLVKCSHNFKFGCKNRKGELIVKISIYNSTYHLYLIFNRLFVNLSNIVSDGAEQNTKYGRFVDIF